MKELRTEIEINAPPERVWQLLTDFASFPQWNQFIRRASGEPRKGAQLQVHLRPSGAKGMTFRPKVLKAEPNRELRWLGHFLIPGLFDGEHIFTIETLYYPIYKQSCPFSRIWYMKYANTAEISSINEG